MSKEDNQQQTVQQFAMIWNYNAHVEHQHNYYSLTPNPSPVGEGRNNNANDNDNETVLGSGAKVNQPNLDTPCIVLQKMLLGGWFDEVCTNTAIYNKEWRERLVADLMATEHGKYIAGLWEHACKRQTVKGRFIGTLALAGVLKGSNLSVARVFLGISKNTRDEDEKRDASTFANYMGKAVNEPYADWVRDYVAKVTRKA